MPATLHFVFGFLLLVSVAVWACLFFGLNYPEVVRAKTWAEAACTTTSKTTDRVYHTWLECACWSAVGLPACADVQEDLEWRDPDLCGEQPGHCAHTATCGNGYRCCDECCDESCSCCDSVFDELCTVRHEEWTWVRASGLATRPDAEPVPFVYRSNHRADSATAAAELDTIVLDATVRCLLDPEPGAEGPHEAVYRHEYTAAYWAASGVCAGLTWLVIGTWVACRLADATDWPGTLLFWLTWALSLPGVALLLVALDCDVAEQARANMRLAALGALLAWLAYLVVYVGLQYRSRVRDVLADLRKARAPKGGDPPFAASGTDDREPGLALGAADELWR